MLKRVKFGLLLGAALFLPGCVPNSELATLPGARVLVANANAFQERANPGFMARRENARRLELYREQQARLQRVTIKVQSIEQAIRANNMHDAGQQISQLLPEDLGVFTTGPAGEFRPTPFSYESIYSSEFRSSENARFELARTTWDVMGRLISASASVGEATRSPEFTRGSANARSRIDTACRRADEARQEAIRHLAADRAEAIAWNAANPGGQTWTESIQMPGRSGSVLSHPFGWGVGAPLTGSRWVNEPGEVVTQTRSSGPRPVPRSVRGPLCAEPQVQAAITRAVRLEGALSTIPNLVVASWSDSGDAFQPTEGRLVRADRVVRTIEQRVTGDSRAVRSAFYVSD